MHSSPFTGCSLGPDGPDVPDGLAWPDALSLQVLNCCALSQRLMGLNGPAWAQRGLSQDGLVSTGRGFLQSKP